jgi:hypothetical protein
MGLRYTVETIGELRKALAGVPDDVTFQCNFDGMDYRELEVQSHFDSDHDARFIRFTLPNG